MSSSTLTYALRGRLVLSQTNWVLLEVPNSIGNGLFQALHEPGVEQPISDTSGKYNAHISVMRPSEVQTIGVGNITERGKLYGFNITGIREISEPAGWPEVSKAWVAEVQSPELQQLRRTYGLPAPRYPLHITVAIRRRNVLRSRPTQEKAASSQIAIRNSAIHGRGIHATRQYEPGDVIIDRFMVKLPDIDGDPQYEQSEACRFTNHSAKPNSRLQLDGSYVELIADDVISPNEEITADYDECGSLLGKNVRFAYRGRPYDGSATDGDAIDQEKRAASLVTSVLWPVAVLDGLEFAFEKAADLAKDIEQARQATAEPASAEQAAAGNYAKGKFKAHGLQFTLENPKGSTRSGVAEDGTKWSNTVTADYGYINRTEGADGDHVDAFIGPSPDSELVFVVNQLNPNTQKFDEHKVIFGHICEADAKDCYLSNYDSDWKGFGSICPMTISQFRDWLDTDLSSPARAPVVKKGAAARQLLSLLQGVSS